MHSTLGTDASTMRSDVLQGHDSLISLVNPLAPPTPAATQVDCTREENNKLASRVSVQLNGPALARDLLL